MTVPTWPNVTVVNSLGDFEISHSRLAFIDGEIDPWRPCTPHSRHALPREDTIKKPFKLIPGKILMTPNITISLIYLVRWRSPS